MAYNANSFVKLNELKLLAQRVASEINSVASTTEDAIKYINVSGNTVSFWKDAAHTGKADFSFDFPNEIFLDQTRTNFVRSFAFSATAYPGATNPSLDGKPVLVFAVRTTTDRTNGTVNDTYRYSFIDMSALVDTYTVKSGDSEKILSISDYEIEVHISSVPDNAITVEPDGLHVDISGKADKVSGATAGNIAALDADGNIIDSGVAVATNADVNAMLDEVFGSNS